MKSAATTSYPKNFVIPNGVCAVRNLSSLGFVSRVSRAVVACGVLGFASTAPPSLL